MTFLRLVPALLAVVGSLSAADATAPVRERLLLDRNWRFAVGTPDLGGGVKIAAGLSVDLSQSFGAYAKAGGVGGPAAANHDDLAWRRVDLPHDWAVEMPFSEKADCAHGSKTVGPQFPASSVAWYRRTFNIPAEDVAKRLEVQFDGVFRDSEVYLNGHYLGRNFSGYAPVAYDLTPYLNYGGANTLAVKVNATSFEGWFYEGAGIYRHVWLVKTAPVHVPQWGTYVTSTVTGDPAGPTAAALTARTTVRNESDAPATVTLVSRVLDGAAAVVEGAPSAPTTIAPWAEVEIEQVLTVAKPRLWSTEDPHLYQVETAVVVAGATVDTYRTTTGIRTLRYDANQGFFLNGKRVFMKGTCNHQDHAGVGTAIPDRLNVWRLEQLKALGSNAYRCTHNPPTPEVLEACDRLGILVMDESRTVGATDEALSQMERLIRRDRNHPSVVMWCLGNEEMNIQSSDTGARIIGPLQRLTNRLDPTRPTTLAMNGSWGEGFSKVVDVQGGNYLKLGGGFDNFHKRHPTQPVLGSEEGSHTTTRGSYAQDDQRKYCHADEAKARFPGWASTAEAWMKHYDERPYLAGSFVWTGFDYRGEPTPYHQWPSINSHFGILDTCGFPKDVAFFYRAWWTTQPVLNLLPHWNWPEQVGKPIDVRCDGNAEEVELFLNGVSLGRKAMPRLGHLAWPGVIYQPGSLVAKGFTGGKQVSEKIVETTGPAAAVRLTPDRPALAADGEDLAVITVAITDAQGRMVPTANDTVTFSLAGPGRILGVGNGNPTCHEADQVVTPPPAVVVAKDWKVQVVTGDGRAEAGPTSDTAAWPAATFDGKTLTSGQTAVWRALVTLTAMQAARAEIASAKADGTAQVLINGTEIPGVVGRDPNRTLVLPTGLLREGVNHLAVIVSVTGKTGGLRAAPRLVTATPATEAWQRSAFHGLAQILVQAGTQPGHLVLTAAGQGLAPTTLTIPTNPAEVRPFVP